MDNAKAKLWLALYSAFLLVVYVLSFTFVKQFWKLREKKPVSSRIPEVIVFHFLFGFIPLASGWLSLLSPILSFRYPLTVPRVLYSLWITLIITTVTARIWHFDWHYTLARYEIELIWKSQLRLQVAESWAARYTWLFADWRHTLSAVLSVALVIFCAFVLPMAFVTSFKLALQISAVLQATILLLPALYAMHQISGYHDIYGIGYELKLQLALCVLWAAIGLVIGLLYPLGSLSHRLSLNFGNTAMFGCWMFVSTRLQVSRNSAFLAGAIHGDSPLRLENLSTNSNSPHSQSHLGTNTTNAEEQTDEYFKRVLADSSAFGLFAEHCISEMSAENVLFIVAYMRLKEYLFRHLKAEDLFLFEESANSSDDCLLLQHILKSSARHSPNTSTPTRLDGITIDFAMPHLCTEPLSKSALLAFLREDAAERAQKPSDEKIETDLTPTPERCYRKELGQLVFLPTELLEMQRMQPSLGQCVTKLVEVYDKYVDLEGAQCVNVSTDACEDAFGFIGRLYFANGCAELRPLLLECLQPMDAVLREVIQLLKTEAFARFVRSAVFELWLSKQQ